MVSKNKQILFAVVGIIALAVAVFCTVNSMKAGNEFKEVNKQYKMSILIDKLAGIDYKSTKTEKLELQQEKAKRDFAIYFVVSIVLYAGILGLAYGYYTLTNKQKLNE